MNICCVILNLFAVHSHNIMGNSASHLRPEIIADISDSTDFSANEIREWYYSFTRDCSPGRMTISKEEFIALYGEMFPKGDATKFAEQVK